MEKILWVAFTAEARKKQLESSPSFITTFRKGAKWLRADLIGKRVELVNCQIAHPNPCDERCEVFARATVIAVKSCAFKNIEQVDHQRQSSDMTTSNRLQVMMKVYGQYDEDTLTTVITLGDIEVTDGR